MFKKISQSINKQFNHNPMISSIICSSMVSMLAVWLYYSFFYPSHTHDLLHNVQAIVGFLASISIGFIVFIALVGMIDEKPASCQSTFGKFNDKSTYFDDFFKRPENQQEVFSIISELKKTIK